jgi:hypothetical protein
MRHYSGKRIVELASQSDRNGYRQVTALLRNEGWVFNHKHVQRIWREEWLKETPKNSQNVVHYGSMMVLLLD